MSSFFFLSSDWWMGTMIEERRRRPTLVAAVAAKCLLTKEGRKEKIRWNFAFAFDQCCRKEFQFSFFFFFFFFFSLQRDIELFQLTALWTTTTHARDDDVRQNEKEEMENWTAASAGPHAAVAMPKNVISSISLSLSSSSSFLSLALSLFRTLSFCGHSSKINSDSVCAPSFSLSLFVVFLSAAKRWWNKVYKCQQSCLLGQKLRGERN
jgi:hypothetical protein